MKEHIQEIGERILGFVLFLLAGCISASAFLVVWVINCAFKSEDRAKRILREGCWYMIYAGTGIGVVALIALIVGVPLFNGVSVIVAVFSMVMYWLSKLHICF